jgi:hypothetical protein
MVVDTFECSCIDGVSAVANAAWLSLRMIGSDAQDGEPGWRVKIRKPLLMGAGRIWQGRIYSRPRRRDSVVVSLIKNKLKEETDGFGTN